MQQKTSLLFIFVTLTLINGLLFFFRDSFQFETTADLPSLYKECDQGCIQKWEQYIHDYPEKELKTAKRISDSLTSNSKGTKGKILSIGAFLYRRFSKQLGRPSMELLRASPLTQYQLLSSSGTSELWCGNFAEMFSFFCWSQGIICRNVEIMRPGDRHVLNECYLPELSQWVMVDVTSNLLLVSDERENPLNLIAFRQKIRSRLPVRAVQFTNDSSLKVGTIAAVPHYYTNDYPLMFYHRVNNERIYRPAAKISRYFLPLSWYDIYGGKKHSNLPFYLKEVFSFLWLISFFVFLVSRAKFKI